MKCPECNLYLQKHYQQTFFVIEEYNEEYDIYEVAYKDSIGKPRKVLWTCNNGSCSLNK
ncbi:MAG: hypothetical protein K0S93_72 [Nitrososphaeraceae archaeon]|jgi:hypothetical protein|nr:hypothetical protein [Nitrososphaeraceae archaeon]